MKKYYLRSVILTITKEQTNCTDDRIMRYLYHKGWTSPQKIAGKLNLRLTRVFACLVRLRRKRLLEKKHVMIGTDGLAGTKARTAYKNRKVCVVLYRKIESRRISCKLPPSEDGGFPLS